MWTLFKKEIRELWRTRRFLVVAAVMIVFACLGPLSVKYMPLIMERVPGVPEGLSEVMPAPDISMAVSEYVDNLSLFGIILAILVPMGAVVGEKERNTAAMVLSKPVSRAAFLGAKIIAYAVVFLVSIALAGLIGYYYLGILFEWLNPFAFLALSAMLMVYLMMYLAITVFTSTIARSQSAAAGISFGVLILLGLLGAIPSVSVRLPAFLLKWGQALALGMESEPSWVALGVTAALIAIAWLGALLILRRQEI
jgi:ABC-2 type transport system permease protein